MLSLTLHLLSTFVVFFFFSTTPLASPFQFMATSSSIAGTTFTLPRRSDAVLQGGVASRVLSSVPINNNSPPNPKRLGRLIKHKVITCRASAGARASTREAVAGVVVEKEKGKEGGRVLRVGVICGGPSAERGISLNSARSVLDHLQVHLFSITIIGKLLQVVNSALSLICF